MLRLALACCILLASPPLLADPTGEREAQQLFQRGQQAYRAGRFAEAVELLRRAYALYPEPTIVYNTGRAYEGMGERASAIAAFREYLSKEPHAPDRAAIELHIATLQRELDEREALLQAAQAAQAAQAISSQPPTTAAPVAATRTRGRRAAPFVLLGVGAAVLVAGGVTGGLALADRNDAAADPVGASAERTLAGAQRLAIGANVSFTLGGVLAGAGIVWAIVDAARGARLR